MCLRLSTSMLFFYTIEICRAGIVRHRCQLRCNCQRLKVDPTNTSKPRRRCSFFNSGHCCCRSVRGTGTAQLLDFNIVVTLISFILSEKWLESRARQSIGDAIASLLALQAPTALLVEEDAVLVEQEVAIKLLLECIASFLRNDEQTRT